MSTLKNVNIIFYTHFLKFNQDENNVLENYGQGILVTSLYIYCREANN